jgi:hypothetical protein
LSSTSFTLLASCCLRLSTWFSGLVSIQRFK